MRSITPALSVLALTCNALTTPTRPSISFTELWEQQLQQSQSSRFGITDSEFWQLPSLPMTQQQQQQSRPSIPRPLIATTKAIGATFRPNDASIMAPAEIEVVTKDDAFVGALAAALAFEAVGPMALISTIATLSWEDLPMLAGMAENPIANTVCVAEAVCVEVNVALFSGCSISIHYLLFLFRINTMRVNALSIDKYFFHRRSICCVMLTLVV